MQTGTRFSSRDLRSKRNVQPVLVCQITDHPFGNHQLVGGIFHPRRQEFNLILFIYFTIQGKITNFRMPVFYLSSRLCDILHTLRTELVELRIRPRFMISALISCREQIFLIRNHIILQLSHRLELHTCHIRKRLACLVQRIFRRAFQRFAILIKERAQHAQRRQFGKRIDKRRTETRNHIQVAATRLDKRKQARTVHTFPAGQDCIQICSIVNNKIQCFQAPVTGRIHKVHHPDILLFNVRYDIRLCKFGRWLLKELNQKVGIHV